VAKTFNDIWENVHKNARWGRYPSEDVVRFVARNYYSKDRSSIKILDLGCGAGSNTWYLAREGFDVYAVDGSAAAVRKNLSYLDELGLRANVAVSDLAELKYGDGFFDVVIDSAAISANTVNAVAMILSETYRVLKTNGTLFSTGLFSYEATGFGDGKEIETGTYDNIGKGPLSNLGTVHFFTREEVVRLCTDAGFKDLSIDTLTRTERGGEVVVSYFMVSANK
jgi:SAM-dependent methyltransferase